MVNPACFNISLNSSLLKLLLKDEFFENSSSSIVLFDLFDFSEF